MYLINNHNTPFYSGLEKNGNKCLWTFTPPDVAYVCTQGPAHSMMTIHKIIFFFKLISLKYGSIKGALQIMLTHKHTVYM